MRDLLATFAVILLLMYYPAQSTADNLNNKKTTIVNSIVDNSVENARSDGYFKTDNIDEMTTEIATALYLDKSEIKYELTTSPIYRTDKFNNRNSIKYKVSVPIKQVIAMNSFFGIDKSKNQYYYVIQGEAPSELLP